MLYVYLEFTEMSTDFNCYICPEYSFLRQLVKLIPLVF